MSSIRQNIGKNFLAMLLSVVILFSSVAPAYAFDPVTHGYIGQETQKVVTIVEDGTRQPDEYVFHSGAISADVMHLDNINMHDNHHFSEVMMNIAGDTKQLSYAASFRCHQKSDAVWADWADSHGIPRGAMGGLAGLLALPIEGFYEFLFGSRAVLYEDYVIPNNYLIPMLYLDKDLIQRAYDAETGQGPNQPPGWELEGMRDFLWCMMVGEYLLIDLLEPITRANFDLSPWGPYHTVKHDFTGTMNTAISDSKMAIEERWYEFKLVGTDHRSCKAGSVIGKDCDDCQEEQDPNYFPLLTDGWERSHLVFTDTHEEWRSGFCGDGWEWTTGNNKDPNVYIRMWADAPRWYVSADFEVWARLKKLPEDKTEPLRLSPGLSDEMKNKRAVLTFTIDDALLTESEVNLEDIKDRQDTVLGNIWKAVGEAGETIYEDDLAEVDEGELAYNEQLANLIANTAIEFEKSLLNYYALETRKQAILSGRDLIQPMPEEILPYGVEPEVPGGEPIIVFASDFDYFLAFDLVDFLKEHNYAPIRVAAEEFENYKNEKRIVVLGGLYPSQGVDSIVQELLTSEELAELDKEGYLYTVKTDVFTEGQKIIIFSGKNSFLTRELVIVSVDNIPPSAVTPLWGLYAGVSNEDGRAAVYHYSGKGTEWTLISIPGGLGNVGEAYAVLCLVEYNGELYAGTMSECSDSDSSVGRVYRYLGGTEWQQVGGPLDNQVCSLAVYNRKLYAGTAYTVGTTAMKLYRWDSSWACVVNYPAWDGTRSLYVWDGLLYLGDIYADRIGRYNGFTGFTPVADLGGWCIYDFELYQNNLYASCFRERLAKSSDGVSWSYAIMPPWTGSNHMWELENFQYHLYMGYENGDLRILGPLGATSEKVWTTPNGQGIISMTTDRLDQQLFIGTGAEAGFCCPLSGQGCLHPYGTDPSGNGLVYMYDGTGAPKLISERMGNGVQVVYWCHHEVYDQLKSFEDLLKSQAAGLKSFENLLKAQFFGTLYAAHNDGAKCYLNGAVVFNSLAQKNVAYTGQGAASSGQWDKQVDISGLLQFGKNVVACEVQNQDKGSTSGGFDAAVEIDGNWVIPRGDDDMDQSTNDNDALLGTCGDNPLWKYWYDGRGGPPPIDSNGRDWYELDYADGAWNEGHSPLGDPGGSSGSHNAFACTCKILCEDDNKSHAFFRKSFDLLDPSLLFSFEFLLKKQAVALDSFEDLLIAHWDELPPDAKTVLLESFEDLLMSQAEAILSFEELMKKFPV